MGLVSLTVMVKVLPEGELAVGTNEEKKPFSRGWQGSAKELCVTVWFWEMLDFADEGLCEGWNVPLGRKKTRCWCQLRL